MNKNTWMVNRTTKQALSYFAFEAILMPISIESNDRFVGDRLLAILTFAGEQFLEIRFAVWLSILFEEWHSGHWLFAWTIADKVILMPCLAHGFHNFLQFERWKKTKKKKTNHLKRSLKEIYRSK